MLRTVSAEERRLRRQERRLKRIAMLPALFTLGNLLSGFAAICCCLLSIKADGADMMKMTLGSQHLERMFPTFLSIGAFMIAVGLVCDGLDGRVARWTRRTSDFGGQLDSLADVITFGAAPALLVVCLILSLPEATRWPAEWATLARRGTWVAAAIYTACAALRLARFNVENVHDESAHYWFKGLPSPGAAGTIAALILFHEHICPGIPVLGDVVQGLLPPLTLAAGLLMVSRVRYAHLTNLYFRRKRPLSHLVAVMILVLSIFLKPTWGLAIFACAYVLSGPVVEGWRRLFARPEPTAQPSKGEEASEADHPPTGGSSQAC
ncbi:MAG: CDP-alcohol phosphatidyltransferase family protein [Phycisphaerae bacterium]|nr:CDP-alcohol phosphatidyltransferase family protein [Phycisphaerae bacterium]